MKKYNILLIVITIISFASCEKYDGNDSYNFSNNLSNYIRFTPNQGPIEINSETVDTFLVDSITGDTTEYYYYLEDEPSTTFQVETRVGFTENVNYTYTISSSLGENIMEGTLTKQSISSVHDIAFPVDTFENIDGDTISGEIKLVSASGATIGDLNVGYPLTGDNTTIDFIANKPNVLHPKE